MKSKTVIAVAVAGAFALPFAANAYDSARVSTPLSDNETGAQVQMQHDRFTPRHDALMESGSWEVQTPLSVNETAPATSWTGVAHDRIAIAEPGDYSFMTASGSSESSGRADEGVTVAEPERSSSLSDQASEDFALADEGISSDYYVVGIPEQTTDYYIVESVPVESYNVVLVPFDTSWE